MKELKPCPFCCGEAKLTHSGTFHWWIQCAKCKVESAICDTGADTTILWNTRPSPWIKITPTTMPEESGDYLLVLQRFGSCGNEWVVEKTYYETTLGWSTRAKCTHYMPIPPIPKK